jgi:hypothetical protein
MTRRWSRAARVAVLALVVSMLGSSRSARAQSLPSSRVQPELRVDVLGGRRTSVQGGVGVEIPSGPYVRVGLIAGAGERVGSTTGAAGRFDILARFLLDPYRQARWGLSAGGGVSLRADRGDRVRPNLLLAMDLEGPRTSHGFSPAVQVGFGGGVRGGIGLRWSGRTSR